MVVSQNKGTPIYTQIYYSPYYRDPQKGTPNLGKPSNRFWVDQVELWPTSPMERPASPRHWVTGLGLTIQGLGFRVFRAYDSGFRV